MKKLMLIVAITSASLPSFASAHPVGVAYETRGECEVAFEKSSKLDRERLVDQLGVFESYGAAQSTFRDTFKCEYDEDEQAWFIVFIGGGN